MKKRNIKLLSGLMTSALVVGAIGAPVAGATSIEEAKNNHITINKDFHSSDNLAQQDFHKAFELAIQTSKDDFVDPSVADELLEKYQQESEIVTHGKVTMTAKAGAKAIKSLMNNVGEKAWNQMVKKVENTTGQDLVMFHWDGINGLLDFLVNSGETITEAIKDYLIDWGFNKTLASIIAEAFVFIVF